VVVLDISMPGMDGFEVCQRLRADVRTAFVPVLILTAHNVSDFVTRGFAAGADDYIVKPFRRPDLIARIRRMLERTYGHGYPADTTPVSEDDSTLDDVRSVIDSLRAELARVESHLQQKDQEDRR
jgi:DNA-binding response OmpR family regulator